MKFLTTGAAALALFAATTVPALAHFQLIHTETPLIERPGDVPVRLIFWHPFEAGHAMDMGTPSAFFMVHHGERTDLSDRLTPATFAGPENEAAAFDATVPVKRSGDYVLVVEPEPYLEPSEDIYIQQITKHVINRGTLPTDWDAELGLKTEIVPLSKPYNIITGSSFSGRVMSDGKPVPGAEIEVEYIAAEPSMDGPGAGEPTVGPMPGGAVVIRSDADGEFTFAVPRAGYWGFAALGVGPDTEFEGKELSQDAVIWIRAWDMAPAGE